MESIKEEPVQIIDPIQEKFLELAENNSEEAYKFLVDIISKLSDPIKKSSRLLKIGDIEGAIDSAYDIENIITRSILLEKLGDSKSATEVAYEIPDPFRKALRLYQLNNRENAIKCALEEIDNPYISSTLLEKFGEMTLAKDKALQIKNLSLRIDRLIKLEDLDQAEKEVEKIIDPQVKSQRFIEIGNLKIRKNNLEQNNNIIDDNLFEKAIKVAQEILIPSQRSERLEKLGEITLAIKASQEIPNLYQKLTRLIELKAISDIESQVETLTDPHERSDIYEKLGLKSMAVKSALSIVEPRERSSRLQTLGERDLAIESMKEITNIAERVSKLTEIGALLDAIRKLYNIENLELKRKYLISTLTYNRY